MGEVEDREIKTQGDRRRDKGGGRHKHKETGRHIERRKVEDTDKERGR